MRKTWLRPWFRFVNHLTLFAIGFSILWEVGAELKASIWHPLILNVCVNIFNLFIACVDSEDLILAGCQLCCEFAKEGCGHNVCCTTWLFQGTSSIRFGARAASFCGHAWNTTTSFSLVFIRCRALLTLPCSVYCIQYASFCSTFSIADL